MKIVAALGGNALLERGESSDAGIQEAHVTSAVTALTPVLRDDQCQLLITHGNGPQAGVLAVESAGDPALSHPYPFDSVPLRRARRADSGNDRVPAGPGTEHCHPRAPGRLRTRPFPAGSMAPKVAAVRPLHQNHRQARRHRPPRRRRRSPRRHRRHDRHALVRPGPSLRRWLSSTVTATPEDGPDRGSHTAGCAPPGSLAAAPVNSVSGSSMAGCAARR